jgi:hypothetical protein
LRWIDLIALAVQRTRNGHRERALEVRRDPMAETASRSLEMFAITTTWTYER